MKRLKQGLRGGKNILAWWLGDEDPVPKELAQSRAAVCIECPKNVDEGFYETLTGFAADKMRAAFALKKKLNLTLPDEKKLGVCDVCGCHMRLKVWSPLKIASNMPQDELFALWSECWILEELTKKK